MHARDLENFRTVSAALARAGEYRNAKIAKMPPGKRPKPIGGSLISKAAEMHKTGEIDTEKLGELAAALRKSGDPDHMLVEACDVFDTAIEQSVRREQLAREALEEQAQAAEPQDEPGHRRNERLKRAMAALARLSV